MAARAESSDEENNEETDSNSNSDLSGNELNDPIKEAQRLGVFQRMLQFPGNVKPYECIW